MLLHNKRGELTTTQIVGLVVLILSFVIILFLIFQLNLGETTKKEVCRDSVILKGKSLLPTGSTPLNCQQEYICFSKTNDCSKLDNPDRIIRVANKNGFYRALADEMADCWWMFGAGEVDYVGSDWTQKLQCSICSQFYFDKSMKEVIGDEVSQKEFYEYLSTVNYSGGISYHEYLYGGKGEYDKIYDNLNFDTFRFDNENPYLIIMGINNDISTLSWIAGGAVVGIGLGLVAAATVGTGGLALGFLAAGAASGSVGGAVGAGLGVTFAGYISPGKTGLNYLRPVIVEKESEHFKAFKCGKILTRT